MFIDLPLNETLDCIKNALANAILLKNNDRGAGHITAVAAMFSGTPQIVSDVAVLRDYFIDGVSAITVSIGDAQAVRIAIEKLMSDRAYSERLIANARSYAERWLTNERVIKRITYALTKLVECQELAAVDPEWLEAYESLKRASNNDVFAA
jgi:glycosyltransferase involved in cell wall biosynthesis